MNKFNYKKILPDVLAILAFVVISFVYFFEPIRDGKVLTGVDHSAAVGSGMESQEYAKTHNGELTRWTNSLFCGMPTYQMSPSYKSTTVISQIQKAYHLWMPDLAGYVFMMLLGFYIMLRAFNFKTWMAALGAILWAFSSYYFIIIAAGHIWKLLTLSCIPPTIGGMILCYRNKYLSGIAVTGIFTALQILSNHVQMTYYFLFVMGFMALGFLCQAIANKQYANWAKATGCVILGGVLGVLANSSNLYHTWQYSKETMRSKTELTQKTKNAADQTNDGLERSYITAWSYGGDELLTLMIPNAKGGASQVLSENATAMSKADPNLAYSGVYNAFTQYYGEQPGTSGPVYIGAFVCFLFILGLLIVKGPMKWALFGATLLSILLSLGHNLMPVTDFFLDYVPMYDKFRTVASILVIAEFTMPLLGLLALKQLVDQPETLKSKRVTYSLYISLALTAGVCLLLWWFPSIMPACISSSDVSNMQQYVARGYMDQGTADQIMASIATMRQAMFTADCKRSLMIILIGFAALMIYRTGKLKAQYMVGALTVLCLIDMWSVNKRYLNDGMFSTPQPAETMIPKTQTDEQILQDPDKYYRVLNLSVNTFNDNTTSCYHKSIGGYHAAKLRRYQELIEAHLGSEAGKAQQAAAQTGGHLEMVNGDSLLPALNMLNMKYLILGLKDGGTVPIVNPWANGNAWFVDNVQYVDNADDELAQIGKVNTKHTAIANKQFESLLGQGIADSTANVKLTDYEANQLGYDVTSAKGGVIVFSEIYYPGWTCTVDGKDTEIGRVNYVLRAIRIDGGKHHVVLTFDPQSVHTTDTIAYIAVGLLVLFLLLAVIVPFVRKKK